MLWTAIYWLWEFNKVVTEEIVNWTITTTYIGMAPYKHDDPNKMFTDDSCYAKPIFRIKKIVETTNWGTTDTVTYFPDANTDFAWTRDSWAQEFLNYNYI